LEESGGFDIPLFCLSFSFSKSTSFVEALGEEVEVVVGAVEADSDLGGVRVGDEEEWTEVEEVA